LDGSRTCPIISPALCACASAAGEAPSRYDRIKAKARRVELKTPLPRTKRCAFPSSPETLSAALFLFARRTFDSIRMAQDLTIVRRELFKIRPVSRSGTGSQPRGDRLHQHASGPAGSTGISGGSGLAVSRIQPILSRQSSSFAWCAHKSKWLSAPPDGFEVRPRKRENRHITEPISQTASGLQIARRTRGESP
jgi:hypothetical protein